jgi:hypothetical protein
MGATLDDAAEQALRVGPLARAAAELDDATKDRIRVIVKDAFATFQTPAGITPPAACWLVGARI